MTSEAVAIDDAHIALIVGVIKAAKPDRVLELGFGSGQTTKAIADALAWNGHGSLVTVDNWVDWGGVKPEHAQGFAFLELDEADALQQLQMTFSVIVSDADHRNAGRYIDLYLKILAPGGVLFFHDTNQPNYPTLFSLRDLLALRGIAWQHFTVSTRPDERCDRGLLMVLSASAGP